MLEFFKSTGTSAIESVEEMLVGMLRDGHDVYETASDALFGGGKSKETKQEVRDTDRGINKAQRDVRRELMVHAAVSGSIDLPIILTYMSVVKDAERIGDYAKNIWDLAHQGTDLSTAEDLERLASYRERISLLIAQTAQTFLDRNTDEARSYLSEADALLKEYDERINECAFSERPSTFGVPRALYYRYLKRITAHLMNVLTALTMPIDHLAYFDEAEEDRMPLDE